MIAERREIVRKTQGNDEILDLTDEIQDLARRSGIPTGQLVAMVIGSTAALSTTECEPGLVRRDIAAALARVAPADGAYAHEQTWHDDNGHSHVRATLVGPRSRCRSPMGAFRSGRGGRSSSSTSIRARASGGSS